MGRFRGRHGRAVVDDDDRRPVEAEVELPGVAALFRDGAAPRRRERFEETVLRAVGEDEVGSAEPHVRARVRLFGTDAVVDVLRAHVEPPHVHVGMLRLVGLLHERQQVPTVR